MTQLTVLALILAQGVGPAVAASNGAWTVVASEQAGKFAWTMKVKRVEGSGAESRLQPCLLVGAVLATGPFSIQRNRYLACEHESEWLTATSAPLIAASVQPAKEGKPSFTAVGILIAPAVKRMELMDASGRSVDLKLRQLTQAQARSSGLARYRYATFATRGEWCVERLTTRNAAGRILWDSGVDGYPC